MKFLKIKSPESNSFSRDFIVLNFKQLLFVNCYLGPH
jgi:hypothetical protein